MVSRLELPVQCKAVYDRPAEAGGPETVVCQYIAGHPADRHSWSTLKGADDLAIEKQRQKMLLRERNNTQVTGEIELLIGRIKAGAYDEYLELILSAGHDRKRARRGVRGFG